MHFEKIHEFWSIDCPGDKPSSPHFLCPPWLCVKHHIKDTRHPIPMYTDDMLHTIVNRSPVTLFMKGTAQYPMCGFSRMVVRALQHIGVPFEDIDILQDPDLRDQLKTYSQWPTYPQLYVQGELIGGCDIVQDMMVTGELAALLSPFVPVSVKDSGELSSA